MTVCLQCTYNCITVTNWSLAIIDSNLISCQRVQLVAENLKKKQLVDRYIIDICMAFHIFSTVFAFDNDTFNVQTLKIVPQLMTSHLILVPPPTKKVCDQPWETDRYIITVSLGGTYI